MLSPYCRAGRADGERCSKGLLASEGWSWEGTQRGLVPEPTFLTVSMGFLCSNRGRPPHFRLFLDLEPGNECRGRESETWVLG